MSLSPVIGTEVPEAPNGVLTAISSEPCSENGPHTTHAVVPGSFKCGGGSSRVPCPGGQGSDSEDDGSLGDTEEENHVDHVVETRVCGDGEEEEGCLDADIDSSATHDLDAQPHTTLLPSLHALDPSAPTATTCTGGGTETGPKEDTEIPTEEVSRSGGGESPGAAPRGDSPQLKHTESKDSPQRADHPVSAAADRQQTDTENVEEVSTREEEEMDDGDDEGEKEKQDEEDDEKREKQRWKQRDAGSPEDELTQPSSHYSSSAPCPSTSCCASSPPPPVGLLPRDNNVACPPHVMAQVRVRNVPERDRIVRGMQDSKSLDEISQACGGGLGSRGGGRGGQSEGRRATISSALELEGTVSHDGDLTHFVAKNLEQKIKMSSKPSLDCSDSDCSGPIHRSRGSARRPADIPPIDPSVLLDLQRHTQEVAHSVEMMMRSLNGTIQNMTALSVGYIQTYRDSVDGLGEAVDMSIKGMYTLMARCEELDRSMQPIHTLAAQIRDIKRTLDALEAICK